MSEEKRVAAVQEEQRRTALVRVALTELMVTHAEKDMAVWALVFAEELERMLRETVRKRVLK